MLETVVERLVGLPEGEHVIDDPLLARLARPGCAR